MKVLQVLGDSAFGGGSYQVISLCKFLKENGHDVKLLSTDKTTIARFKAEGIDVISPCLIKATVSPYQDMLALKHLTKYLRSNRFDIVHTHTSKAGFVGRLAAHLANNSLVIHTIHGYAFDDGYKFPKKYLFKTLEKSAGKRSDLLIAISNELFDITLNERIAGKDKVVLVENGIEWQNFQVSPNIRTETRKTLNVDENQILVGMIGRLSPPKLPEDFIYAANNLRKQQINAKFLIAGDGPLKPNVEKLIKDLNLENEFTCLGFREDIPEILSAIDIFVLPTLWEGRSIALLEAMSGGKAIVTTDIPANRELLANNKEAILVPVQNVDKLTEAILTLIQNENLIEEMGNRVRQKVMKNYSLGDALAKVLLAYNNLIKKAGLK